MELTELKQTVSEHFGVFHCVTRGGASDSKQANFKHSYDPPGSVTAVPDLGKLKEFYSTFGNLTLYHHKESGDAAFFLANPDQWETLQEHFLDWTENLDEEDQEELIPDWVSACVVVGEIPESGNYLLMSTSGDMKGHVFEFEHDGFEFRELGSNISEFVTNMLTPDSEALTNMASHMTFIEGNSIEQWWIEEMRDNKGNTIKTET